MKYISAVAMAVAFAAPASAFDNADCKAFLTGSWRIDTVQEMNGMKAKILANSTYNADGTFAQTLHVEPEGQPAQDMARDGTWDAAPGSKPDTCSATLTPKDQPASTIELTVIDENTVASPEGVQSLRVVE